MLQADLIYSAAKGNTMIGMIAPPNKGFVDAGWSLRYHLRHSKAAKMKVERKQTFAISSP